MDKIKIKTQISGKDMGILNIYVMYRRFSGIFTLIMGTVAIAMSVYAIYSGNITNGVLFLLIAAMFWVYFPYILIKRGKRAVEKNPTFKKPLFYTLDKDGVEVSQGSQHDKVMWENLVKAVELKNAIYLFNSPRSAFIWPKEQIGSDLKPVKEMIKNNMPPNKTRSIKL